MDIHLRRKFLSERFFERYGSRVHDGPFKGMILPDMSSWGADGDKLPKALGQYERELHELIVESQAEDYDVVVNVGCAEGFYAVGLAMLHKNAKVYAFDINAQAQKLCQTAAIENGVESRLEVAGMCDTVILQTVLSSGKKCLLVCDVEGYELQLIDPSQVPALNRTTILIECHDFLNREITSTLKNRLSHGHLLRQIVEGERNPNLHEFQARLGSIDRWLTVCEFRPERMDWLWGIPKLNIYP